MARALRLVVVATFTTFATLTPIVATTSPIITPTVISSTAVVTIVVTITATTTGIPTTGAILAVAIPVLRSRFIGGLSRILEEPQDPVTYAFHLARFAFHLLACLSNCRAGMAEHARRRDEK